MLRFIPLQPRTDGTKVFGVEDVMSTQHIDPEITIACRHGDYEFILVDLMLMHKLYLNQACQPGKVGAYLEYILTHHARADPTWAPGQQQTPTEEKTQPTEKTQSVEKTQLVNTVLAEVVDRLQELTELKQKTRLCRNFLKDGTCPHGEHCRFLHRFQKPCHQFQLTKKCRYQDKCRYSHQLD